MLISGSAVKAGGKTTCHQQIKCPAAPRVPPPSPGCVLASGVFVPAWGVGVWGAWGGWGQDQPWVGGMNRAGGDGMGTSTITSLRREAWRRCACASTCTEVEGTGVLGRGHSGRRGLLPAGHPSMGAALALVPTSPSWLHLAPHLQQVLVPRGAALS